MKLALVVTILLSGCYVAPPGTSSNAPVSVDAGPADAGQSIDAGVEDTCIPPYVKMAGSDGGTCHYCGDKTCDHCGAMGEPCCSYRTCALGLSCAASGFTCR